MLGPLPALHRFVLVLAALVVCVGIGFWFGAMPEIPLNLRVGLARRRRGRASRRRSCWSTTSTSGQARPARARKRRTSLSAARTSLGA